MKKRKTARSQQPAVFRQLKKEIREGLDPAKIPKSVLADAADLLVDEIKNRVAKGQSPIFEEPRRFPAYKNPTNYPDKVRKKFPKKRRRPVNLFLSGKFMSNLKHVVFTGRRPKIRIGFFDLKSQEKERGHREGAKGQLRRPIIPLPNENFARAIIVKIDKYLTEALKNVFK